MADEQDVTPDPSSALEGAIASSPEALAEEQPQGTESSTPNKDVIQEEEPRVPYARLKEVVDEKKVEKSKQFWLGGLGLLKRKKK